MNFAARGEERARKIILPAGALPGRTGGPARTDSPGNYCLNKLCALTANFCLAFKDYYQEGFSHVLVRLKPRRRAGGELSTDLGPSCCEGGPWHKNRQNIYLGSTRPMRMGLDLWDCGGQRWDNGVYQTGWWRAAIQVGGTRARPPAAGATLSRSHYRWRPMGS